MNVPIEGLSVRKLEAKTEPAWAFRRSTGNAYDGIVPSQSQVVVSADVDIIRLISIVDGDFDDGWLLVIGEDDLIGIVRIDLEWVVVNDLEIESAHAVRDQVVSGSEDDMLIDDIGEV